ncbi:MAG: alanine racemase [Pirellulales bacterium]|nr:alanine racemase [Pirellulales bacterium]
MAEQFTMDDVPTPALVVDGAVVRRNLQRLADYGAAHQLSIRPHTKTHKSRYLAQLQLECGAGGLTVAKVGEAQVMADVCKDILLAYPALDPYRTAQLAKLAHQITLHVAVDSLVAVEALAQAAQRESSTIGILVDVDVGMGRTGLQTAPSALELAQSIDRTAGVRLDGILCYPGHIWNPNDCQQEPLAKVAAKLAEVIDLWSRHGLAAKIVSAGSTPTAYQSHLVPQFTEIRPGTYIFNDLNTAYGGFCQWEDCAAKIICTVISTAVPHQVVLDAGSKTLTSDRCISPSDSGHGRIVEYPTAKITKLSEEHGQTDVSTCDRLPQLGERVSVIPNHICPCVNLQDHLWWLEDDVLRPLTVDARGKLN